MLLSQGFLDCELLDLEVSDSPAGLLGISHEKLERCLVTRCDTGSPFPPRQLALSRLYPKGAQYLTLIQKHIQEIHTLMR